MIENYQFRSKFKVFGSIKNFRKIFKYQNFRNFLDFVRCWIWIWIKRNFIRVKYVSKRNFFQFPKSYKNIVSTLSQVKHAQNQILFHNDKLYLVSYPVSFRLGLFIRPKTTIFGSKMGRKSGRNRLWQDDVTCYDVIIHEVMETKMM